MAAGMEHLSYWRANQMLARDKRIGARRRYGNNTWLERLGQDDDGSDVYGVRLHATVVARLYIDGRVELNSGGWLTPTTARRLNAVVPRYCRVASVKGAWRYFYGPLTEDPRERRNVPFRDGLTVGLCGDPLDAAAEGEAE